MATTDEGRMNLDYLAKLLVICRTNNVSEYADGDFHFTVMPMMESTAIASPQPSLPMPSDEETLFWSAGNVEMPVPESPRPDPEIPPKG